VGLRKEGERAVTLSGFRKRVMTYPDKLTEEGEQKSFFNAHKPA